MPDRLPNCHRPKYKIAKYVVKISFSPILDFLIDAYKNFILNFGRVFFTSTNFSN